MQVAAWNLQRRTKNALGAELQRGLEGIGRLAKVVSPAGSFQYGYWSVSSISDRVQSLVLPSLNGGNSIANSYDPLGRLAGTALQTAANGPMNAHEYEYNAGNERTRQTISGKDASDRQHYWDYTYDNIGQLKTAKGKDRTINTTTWDYDEIPRQHEQFGYAYDKAWNLSYRTNNALVQTFTANTLNELTNVTRSGTLTVAGQATGPRADTTYGPVNGVTNVVVSGTGLTTGNALLYADGAWAKTNATLANGNNSYTATAYDTYNRTATDSLTINLPATNNFAYDFNGNLTNDSRRVFEYDYENQLTNVYVASAWKSEFRYDAFGRKRVQKDYGWTGSAWSLTNEVRYIYDGMLVVQERNANNVALVSYTRGNDLSGSLQGAGGIGGLLARTDHAALLSPDSLNAHAYYQSDGNGNVTCLINTNGLVLARYNYDPYGNLLGMNGPLAEANSYRFSSKEWNANAGLYYYGFRFYEPNLQRWLNRDPIAESGGINMFAVLMNNLVFGVDLFGLSGELDGLADFGKYCYKNRDPITDAFRDKWWGWPFDQINDEFNRAEDKLKKCVKNCGDYLKDKLFGDTDTKGENLSGGGGDGGRDRNKFKISPSTDKLKFKYGNSRWDTGLEVGFERDGFKLEKCSSVKWELNFRF